MDKKTAFETMCRIAEGIAFMFGPTCETLVHDMSVPNHPILAIYNGHVSGRKVGSKEDIFGSDVDVDRIYSNQDYVNHLVITPTGKYIKSSTFIVTGEDYHYALGINFDFSPLVASNKMLVDLTNVGTELQKAISEARETHLVDIFEECIAGFTKPADKLNKLERLQLIQRLEQKNFFGFQKSVPFLAEKLNVSRYTVYKYIKEK